jgi:hypothetical protein
MADKQMSVHVTISAADQASAKIKEAAEKLNGLQLALRKAQAATDDFHNRWSQSIGMAEWAGTGMMVAGGAILGLGAMAVKAGSDFTEMSSMFDQVFKGQAAGVRSWADATAEATNRSAADLQKYAASFQGLFVPMGFDRGPAAQMSETVSQLAVDLGSFWNAAEPDVIRDLQSAFAGETEAMRKYGVFLSDAALDQELFNRGIRGGSEAATEAEKAQARLAIIMRATGDAQGDAARTSGSLENQLRGLKAELTEIAVGAGKALVPALEKLTPVLKDALGRVADFVATPAGATFVKWAAGAALATTGTGAVASKLGVLATGVVSMGSLGKSAWELFSGKAKEAADNAGDVKDALDQVGQAGSAVSSASVALGKFKAFASSRAGAVTGGLVGVAAGIGIAELARSAYVEQMDAGRKLVEGLSGGIEQSDAALNAMRDQMSGLLDAAREAAPDMKASGDELARQLAAGMEGNSAAQGWFAKFRKWAEDAASGIEAFLGVGYGGAQRDEMLGNTREVLLLKEEELSQRVREARQKVNALQEGSGGYLQAQNEKLEAQRDLLTVVIKLAQLPGGNRGAIAGYAQELVFVEQQLEANTAALASYNEEQRTSEQLTKAQTKAIADAVKAADGYTDAADAMRDAIRSASESIIDANKRVADAQTAVSDAVQDAADRIGDAQEDLADAVADSAERVQDARDREADAADHLRDVEDKAAKARVSIEQDAADKIADIHDSTKEKVASLVERLGEMQGKLREQAGGGQSNVFRIGGRDVMLSDAEADKLRARQKLLTDIAKVQRQIAEARAEEQRKVGEVGGDLTSKLAEHDAGTSDAIADARKRLADAQEATRRTSVKSARRVVDAEEALAKAKSDATEAINKAEQKRLEAEAKRAKTYAAISEKLTDAAEKLGRAWMELEDSGKQAPGGVAGAMSRADRDRRAATSIGLGIAESTNTSDVQRAMAAFASAAGTATPLRSYQTLAQTNGPRIALPALSSGGPSMAAPMLPIFSGGQSIMRDQGSLELQKRQGMTAGGGMGGGAARVVIGLEPGLVARELQQDPARGVVVQIARATAAKSPGRSTY